MIFDNVNDLRGHLTVLRRLRLTVKEQRWAGELDTLFTQMLALIQEVLTLDEQLQAGTQQFVALRVRLDDILDDKI